MSSTCKNPSTYTQISTTVINKLKNNFNKYDGTPFSFVEISHRSKQYDKLNTATNELIKQYFNANNYICLFMPTGSAMPALYFNFSEERKETYFYVKGDDSQKLYTQMLKCNNNAKKVNSHTQLITLYQHLSESKAKALIHFNQIDDGFTYSLPQLPTQTRGNIISVRNLDYCFPWKQQKLIDDIVYFASETGVSIPGFTVMLIKQQLLCRINATQQCPDMFSFALMHKQKSVVNTPFTLCTYVMNQNLKHIIENRKTICTKIEQNKKELKRKLKQVCCKFNETDEDSRKQADNFVIAKLQSFPLQILNKLIDQGMARKINKNNTIIFYVQQENTNFNALLEKENA